MKKGKITDWSDWGTRHSRAYFHLDYYLQRALEDIDGFLTMNEVRKLLKEETGFLFQSATLKKYNKRYTEEHGMGPLCQFGDKYKLNQCLFELAEIRPNKIGPIPKDRVPKAPAWDRKKSTEYQRIYRHLDYFLDRALEESENFLNIEEIQNLLKEETGFLFKAKTIINYNKKYIEKHGIGPLRESGEKYKLNDALYDNEKIMPPGKRK